MARLWKADIELNNTIMRAVIEVISVSESLCYFQHSNSDTVYRCSVFIPVATIGEKRAYQNKLFVHETSSQSLKPRSWTPEPSSLVELIATELGEIQFCTNSGVFKSTFQNTYCFREIVKHDV